MGRSVGGRARAARARRQTRQGAVMPGVWCMAWMVRLVTCWEVAENLWPTKVPAALDHVDSRPTGRGKLLAFSAWPSCPCSFPLSYITSSTVCYRLWDRLNQVPEHEPGQERAVLWTGTGERRLVPWSMSREHEPPPAHASAEAILSHHLHDGHGHGASSSDLPCPVLVLACLLAATLPCLPVSEGASLTSGRTTKPLSNLPLARTDMVDCCCGCVCVVSVMSGMSCHDSHSCRLRRPSRPTPAPQGLTSCAAACSKPWMDARVAADQMPCVRVLVRPAHLRCACCCCWACVWPGLGLRER